MTTCLAIYGPARKSPSSRNMNANELKNFSSALRSNSITPKASSLNWNELGAPRAPIPLPA